ncbi:MAG: glycosyltransferase family protein [Gallionella sp.]
MKTIIIVQARMTSTRLPGKVMLPVLGTPLLEYQIKRLQRVKSADGVCIACTTNQADQPIVELAHKLGVALYRGSEPDVLARYYEAARMLQAEYIVRVTSDCPVIDPEEIDKLIKFYLARTAALDYAYNGLIKTYPRGMDAEIFSFEALKTAYQQADKDLEREHVTPYLYMHPEKFRLANFAFGQDKSNYRLTVDTPEDFELISRIITALYPVKPEFTIHDILKLLSKHPNWLEINSHIQQKGLAA